MNEKMTFGLENLRRKQESNRELILHKESLSGGCYVSLMEDNSNGTEYMVIRYFFLGDNIHHSIDITTKEKDEAWLCLLSCFT